MKEQDKRGVYLRIRWIALVFCLAYVWSVMLLPGWGEWYAQRIYPPLSEVLSRLSANFSFSIGDCFVCGSIAGLLIYLLYTIIKRKRVIRPLLFSLEYLTWVYVWFYLAWGLNYFRQDFFQRTQTMPLAYSTVDFQAFLTSYTDSLNATYCVVDSLDNKLAVQAVKEGYPPVSTALHLLLPKAHLKAKTMLISPFMSAVGVKGYIGPFFTEYNLNRDLLPVEYANTYAHEMAHVLGVSNEAEANLCSYLVCTSSSVPEIRFSGYFSLLPYVLSNAYHLLPEEEFTRWKDGLRPEVRQLHNSKVSHWMSLYRPWIGEVQDNIYNLFLKSNKIPSGTTNYSEVVAMLIAYNKKSNKN